MLETWVVSRPFLQGLGLCKHERRAFCFSRNEFWIGNVVMRVSMRKRDDDEPFSSTPAHREK
jgi:hypothetical protein